MPKTPAKRAPMPEGYDGTTTRKPQGSPAIQGAVVDISSIIKIHSDRYLYETEEDN